MGRGEEESDEKKAMRQRDKGDLSFWEDLVEVSDEDGDGAREDSLVGRRERNM